VAERPECQALGVAGYGAVVLDEGNRDVEEVRVVPVLGESPGVDDQPAASVALDESVPDPQTGAWSRTSSQLREVSTSSPPERSAAAILRSPPERSGAPTGVG
jgi:hypothetical protein